MRAQFADRSEPDGPMREPGLDRSVRVERIGHPIDDPGFQDRSRFGRRGLAAAVIAGRGLDWSSLNGGRLDRGRRLGRTGRSPHSVDSRPISAAAPALRPGRASPGQKVSKFSDWGAGRAAFERNRKSSRDAFKASEGAAPIRSSAPPRSSDGAVSTFDGRDGCAGRCPAPLGDSGTSSTSAMAGDSVLCRSVRGMLERSRSIAAADTSTADGPGGGG